jgi:hypothetical protein
MLKPDYVVEIHAVRGDDRPATVRLRQFLKNAVRQFGLRCVGVSPTIPEREAQNERVPQGAD